MFKLCVIFFAFHMVCGRPPIPVNKVPKNSAESTEPSSNTFSVAPERSTSNPNFSSGEFSKDDRFSSIITSTPTTAFEGSTQNIEKLFVTSSVALESSSVSSTADDDSTPISLRPIVTLESTQNATSEEVNATQNPSIISTVIPDSESESSTQNLETSIVTSSEVPESSSIPSTVEDEPTQDTTTEEVNSNQTPSIISTVIPDSESTTTSESSTTFVTSSAVQELSSIQSTAEDDITTRSSSFIVTSEPTQDATTNEVNSSQTPAIISTVTPDSSESTITTEDSTQTIVTTFVTSSVALETSSIISTADDDSISISLGPIITSESTQDATSEEDNTSQNPSIISTVTPDSSESTITSESSTQNLVTTPMFSGSSSEEIYDDVPFFMIIESIHNILHGRYPSLPRNLINIIGSGLLHILAEEGTQSSLSSENDDSSLSTGSGDYSIGTGNDVSSETEVY